jgi:hypothetical protein
MTSRLRYPLGYYRQIDAHYGRCTAQTYAGTGTLRYSW